MPTSACAEGRWRILARVAALAAGAACAQVATAAGAPPAAAPMQPAQAVVTAATTGAGCRPDPLGGRALYLRGSFNAWAASDAHRFTWFCQRWELVTRLQGEHRFKLGDEGWSADADFGSADGRRLLRQGPDLVRRFGSAAAPGAGAAAPGAPSVPATYRFTVTMTDTQTPELRIDACPAPEAPLGPTALFLRGTPNNWAALEDYQFQFSCDAYYLNVRLQGRHEFKIADAAWRDASTIGPDGFGQGANFAHAFDGAHTLRLAWAGGQPRLDIGPLNWADPRQAAVTDPVALSLRFDSRQEAHKQPFGAVPTGTEVHFALHAQAGVQRATLVVERRRLEGNQEVLEYTPVARVPMQRSGADAAMAAPGAAAAQGGRERFTASHRFTDAAVYGYWFEVEIGGRLFVYQNNAQPLHWTREKGTGGLGAVADRPAHAGGIRRFRQTVHLPGLSVPDWAADVIYYYVFPERFRNGNRANDPDPARDRYRHTRVERHARWLDRPWKPGSGDGSDDVYNNDFFGGDLDGLADKLDDIRALGANTVYMTPVFRAGSNHKYDHADYLNVDPAFGGNAAFDRLVREAAARGLRVIPDASLNHTGSDSIYFDRYGQFGGQGAFSGGRPNPRSPYYRWYTFDTTQTQPERQYRGWVGVSDLPELDKASPAWRDFAYRSPDSVTRTWLKRGAAGWRMDVAPWVSDDFWREWRQAVKATRPDALTVAETWFDASKYFLGDMFDSTMNYIFRNAVLDYAGGGSGAAMVAQLEAMREAYPAPVLHALMNLLSSHDQPRSLHVLGWQDDERDPQRIALAKNRFRVAVFFQMVYPGAPAIYYGDEVGMTGGEDPYNRGPYPWPDEGGQPDLALRAEFQRLTALRTRHAVLRRGVLGAPVHVDDHVVVLPRQLGDTWALTATNNSAQPRTVELVLPPGAPLRWVDALDPAAAPVLAQASSGAGASLRLTVPAWYGRVLLSDATAR